jgi:hypothetical protein
MIQFPPSPRVFYLDRLEFFRKFAEIFPSQGAPPVSTTPVANFPPESATPVANFSTIFASVVETGGKFATGVNENQRQIYHLCQRRRWQIATGINDNGGKFATGVDDTGGKEWQQYQAADTLK